ncbi:MULTISPECIES: hypothetical protein [Euryhalocaulis]|nr:MULTISPECIES: hypothetical protein [Euryhalocaulis]
MTDYETRHGDSRDTLSRFGRYLRSRSGEVWAFFAVGLVIGLIIG